MIYGSIRAHMGGQKGWYWTILAQATWTAGSHVAASRHAMRGWDGIGPFLLKWHGLPAVMLMPADMPWGVDIVLDHFGARDMGRPQSCCCQQTCRGGTGWYWTILAQVTWNASIHVAASKHAMGLRDGIGPFGRGPLPGIGGIGDRFNIVHKIIHYILYSSIFEHPKTMWNRSLGTPNTGQNGHEQTQIVSQRGVSKHQPALGERKHKFILESFAPRSNVELEPGNIKTTQNGHEHKQIVSQRGVSKHQPALGERKHSIILGSFGARAPQNIVNSYPRRQKTEQKTDTHICVLYSTACTI